MMRSNAVRCLLAVSAICSITAVIVNNVKFSAAACLFSAAVCISAVIPHGGSKNEIIKFVLGFPQVRCVKTLKCRHGCFYMTLCLNTYSVRGNGAMSCKNIEKALEKKYGLRFYVSAA